MKFTLITSAILATAGLVSADAVGDIVSGAESLANGIATGAISGGEAIASAAQTYANGVASDAQSIASHAESKWSTFTDEVTTTNSAGQTTTVPSTMTSQVSATATVATATGSSTSGSSSTSSSSSSTGTNAAPHATGMGIAAAGIAGVVYVMAAL
ncbi:hypothetical protein N7486_001146 [Penicillium sp. IBT 16267x]|nr:hypothetical protein N7486_001146 [Penicillium sp. IBT 16267x]